MSSDIPEANPYLERRQAKIARNESRLEELGLDGRFHNASCQAPTSFDVKHEIDDNSSDKKKEEPTRRSLRLKKIPAEEGSGGKRQRVEVEIQKNRQDRTLANPSSSRARIIKQSEPKPGTTRATEIDLQKCLYGAFDYPVFIGRRLAKTGKLAVIENANIMCENPVTSFNKYSGVCEFKNDVRFLFANINAPDSDIRNEFLNNGGQFTWFGGSRMREESESIQKLISIGKESGNSTACLPHGSSCGIVLWCRLYDSKRRSFEPYVCLGRLGYHSHEIDYSSGRVKMLWNLLDIDFLRSSAGQDGTCLFEDLTLVR